ncbi:hypothetical protein ACWKWK_16660 [Pseudoxanthomonas beigongshangi]
MNNQQTQDDGSKKSDPPEPQSGVEKKDAKQGEQEAKEPQPNESGSQQSKR